MPAFPAQLAGTIVTFSMFALLYFFVIPKFVGRAGPLRGIVGPIDRDQESGPVALIPPSQRRHKAPS